MKIFEYAIKVINMIMLIIFVVSVCAIDSESYIFFVLAAVSMTWLVISGYVMREE